MKHCQQKNAFYETPKQNMLNTFFEKNMLWNTVLKRMLWNIDSLKKETKVCLWKIPEQVIRYN